MANFCPNCGSMLKPSASFCGVCGNQLAVKPVAQDTAPAAPEMPTMDALIPPEITDDMFANANEAKPAVNTADEYVAPTMEAVQPPEVAPAQSAPIPVPAAPPTPQEEAMAASSTPTVASTPVIDDSMYNVYNQRQTAQKQAPTPTPVPTPQRNNMNYNNMHNTQFNNMQNNTTPGKSKNAILPIILIVLILAVIAVDVFVLFPDKIFGKDDDSSSKKNISIVVDAGDLNY